MTRVDFYYNVSDQLIFAYRIVRKVFYDSKVKVDMPLIVKCCNEYQLNTFDDLLYSFSHNDFIPHVKDLDKLQSKTPIILVKEPWCLSKKIYPSIFLNLGLNIDNYFSAFDRVIEIISNNEKDKKIGREKYSFYKTRGYKIFNHDIGE